MLTLGFGTFLSKFALSGLAGTQGTDEQLDASAEHDAAAEHVACRVCGTFTLVRQGTPQACACGSMVE